MAPFNWSVKQTGSLAKHLLKIKEQVAQRYVKVGVFGETRPGQFEVGTVELAVIHEYGAPVANIPARSFLGSNLSANAAAYKALIVKLLAGVVRQKTTVDKALDLLGMQVASDTKRRIRDGSIKQDLSPATLARKQAKGAWNGAKGANGPIRALIDTGRLMEAITWVKGGGE